jgi:hypothetical protein
MRCMPGDAAREGRQVTLSEGALVMTGSNLVLIVVPIVSLSALGLWLGLVMYAGAHPEWKAHRLAREAAALEAAAVAAGEQAAAPAADRAARGPDGVPAGNRKPVSPRAA